MSSAKSNIIACTEERMFYKRPAKTLRELGVERALYRKILSWMNCDGTYGMGGPGFVSFELEKKNPYPKERLCLCLWAASEWLLFDGEWLAAHPNQYEKQKPKYSNFFDAKWDYVTDKIQGYHIDQFEIETRSFVMYLSSGARIELPQDTSKLPLHGGSLAPHEWMDGDDMRDAWVFATGTLWT